MDASIRAELLRLETALATRDGHEIVGGLASLIADDFLEFGASGAAWDAAATRRLVAAEPPTSVELTAFDAVALAPDVVLATYRTGGSRPANRCSIWVRRDGRWRVRFHQGTLVPR